MKRFIALLFILIFSTGLTSCKSDPVSKALSNTFIKTAAGVPPVKKKVSYKESYAKGRGFFRGYTTEKTSKGYRFDIYMGQKNTGGYSIKVTDVRMDEDKVLYIEVETRSPGPEDIVTQAITYPMCSITVDAKPLLAVVYDQNGSEFENINNGPEFHTIARY